jgi:hypothetical protein
MAEPLKTELETYEKHKNELLGTARGKFVLIHDEEIVGTYESQMDATAEGYRRFGNVPFLVKQIMEIEVPATFVSNLLGV